MLRSGLNSFVNNNTKSNNNNNIKIKTTLVPEASFGDPIRNQQEYVPQKSAGNRRGIVAHENVNCPFAVLRS